MSSQQAFTRSHLDDSQRVGMSQQRIDLSGLSCEGLPENRMDVGTGIKVAVPANPLCAGPRWTHVVAELRMVERELHETDEGDRTRGSDLGSNGSNEFRVPCRHKELHLSCQK